MPEPHPLSQHGVEHTQEVAQSALALELCRAAEREQRLVSSAAATNDLDASPDISVPPAARRKTVEFAALQTRT